LFVYIRIANGDLGNVGIPLTSICAVSSQDLDF